MKSMNCFRILVGFLAIILALFAMGCRGMAPEPAPAQEVAAQPRYTGLAVRITGYAADLDPAIRHVVSRLGQGWAVVEIATPEPWEREYQLVSATDEPGWIMIRTPDESPIPNWDRLTKSRFISLASLGRFGDPDLERELLRRLNERLESLATQ